MRRRYKKNKFKKIKNFLITSIILILFLIGISLVYRNNKILFSLNGKENITLNYNETYEDEGITIKKCRLLKCEEIEPDALDVENNLKEELGTYEIIYKATYNNEEHTLKRIINVVDNEKPIILLNGDDNITLTINSNYTDPGCEVTDNYDTALSPSIDSNLDTSKEGNYTITYTATDSSNNTSSLTRNITIKDFSNEEITTYITNLDNELKKYAVSVLYYNIENQYTYTYNKDKLYYGASLIKTLDELYIYEKDYENINNTLKYTSKYQYESSPGVKKYSIGSQIKIKDLVNYAITYSDNSAHMMLYDYIGVDNLRKYAKELGVKNALTSSEPFGNTTVEDQLTYFKKLYELITTKDYGEELKNFGINDFCDFIVFDGMPQNTHKYGFYNTYYHESAIVWDEKPYIIVILSNGNYYYNQDVIANISQKIYNLHELIKKEM